jgi:hypothetical protein
MIQNLSQLKQLFARKFSEMAALYMYLKEIQNWGIETKVECYKLYQNLV